MVHVLFCSLCRPNVILPRSLAPPFTYICTSFRNFYKQAVHLESSSLILCRPNSISPQNRNIPTCCLSLDINLFVKKKKKRLLNVTYLIPYLLNGLK